MSLPPQHPEGAPPFAGGSKRPPCDCIGAAHMGGWWWGGGRKPGRRPIIKIWKLPILHHVLHPLRRPCVEVVGVEILVLRFKLWRIY